MDRILKKIIIATGGTGGHVIPLMIEKLTLRLYQIREV